MLGTRFCGISKGTRMYAVWFCCKKVHGTYGWGNVACTYLHIRYIFYGVVVGMYAVLLYEGPLWDNGNVCCTVLLYEGPLYC